MLKSIVPGFAVLALFGAGMAAAADAKPAVEASCAAASMTKKATAATGEKVTLSAQTRLAVQLVSAMLAGEKSMNVSVSPATLGAALGLAGLGASDETRALYDRCLGFESGNNGGERVLKALSEQASTDENAPLKGAVSVIFDEALKLDPKAGPLLESHGVKPVIADLKGKASVEKINGWIKDATRGAIPAMLDGPPGGAFVSLGALSFKDRWKTTFKAEPEAAAFLKADGASIKVTVVTRNAAEEPFRMDDRFAAVDLAYADPRYHMVIVTARSGKGIQAADVAGLEPWLRGEGFRPAKGDIVLPRFAIEQVQDLLPLLERIGLRDASGFPKFSSQKIELSHILQKTLLKLDENGTEAAAATAVIAERSIQTDRIRVMADSRFAFALRDASTGLVLIAGLVGDPGPAGH